MRFNIQHTIEYHYDRSVFLEPLILLLRPREDAWQRLHEFDMVITPTPAGQTPYIDTWGNSAHLAWFNDLHRTVNIKAVSVVETLNRNPFGFVLTTPPPNVLPIPYTERQRCALAPFLARPSASEEVKQWVESLLAQTAHQVLPFLMMLAAETYRICRQVHRAAGPALPPQQTLAQGFGACRDLAVLFIDACRAAGCASRFVSGYAYGTSAEDERELHAWAEVYLPGAGWKGYDPSIGLMTSDHHVPVASAADPADAGPSEGSYRGTGAKSEIFYSVDIQPLTATQAP